MYWRIREVGGIGRPEMTIIWAVFRNSIEENIYPIAILDDFNIGLQNIFF